MKPARRTASPSLVARLVELPELPRLVRGLEPQAFASLVRRVGVEDAGELVALASTEQLVAAFDEELFSNARPGERETFDAARFATWLEVLLEAGDDAVAARFAELSEDFAAHALSSLVLVLDDDALRERMEEGDRAAHRADKAIESSISEQIDGYLLIARVPDGWDAVLALVLALDRNERELLERVLDRCARLGSRYIDDLDELVEALDDAASLADDVEGEREARRAARGYVEARAARNFLTLARDPERKEERDPVTRAYFRELDREGTRGPAPRARKAAEEPVALLAALSEEDAGTDAGLAPLEATGPAAPIVEALRRVSPRAFAERMEELAYLANVLVAGAETDDGGRFEPARAALAALATVGFGASLAAASNEASALADVLETTSADALFRSASARLSGAGLSRGYLARLDESPPLTSGSSRRGRARK